ncbi:MAG TPA: LUD domain-containing protein [Candidatus Dormibacteraeota bacterium]|jgi:hypothetical protein|nr:LUD domain-containing protein [Candidatus Dormibacteraeota bacterium]
MTTTEPEFTSAATEETIAKIAAVLHDNHIEMVVVDTGAEARQKVLEMIPEGAEVHSGKSKTIEDIGLYADLHESGRYVSVRNAYMKMDRATQHREIRKLSASPDYIVNSVQALTEDGAMLMTSYTGSQIGPIAYGAGQVVLIVGSQKIVPDLPTALRRMYEHVLPYEDARLREQLGVGTKAAKTLILSAEGRPGRTTVILVREPIGV